MSVREPYRAVIASKDVEVKDPNMPGEVGYMRQVLAGQPVPPDLLDAYYDVVGKPAEKAERAPAKDKAVRAPDASK